MEALETIKGTGIVKSWDKKRGHGFIESTDSRKTMIYADSSTIHALPGVYRQLNPNEKVEFEAKYVSKHNKSYCMFEATRVTGMFHLFL